MPMLRRVVALAAGSLFLASCAVPGQGAPGSLASWDGQTVTSSQVDAITQAWDDETDGAQIVTRRVALTYELLGDAFIDAAAEAGTPVREGDARSLAQMWLTAAGIENPEPGPEVVASTHAIAALYALTTVPDGRALIEEAAAALEEDGTFSPRVGEFTTEQLITSITQAYTIADSLGLGDQSFIAFSRVSGFADADQPWAAHE
ncbi:hypothetical protein [Demequina pelophila]|uniref:hypothetical protein n=1 Tax=Demequina pelophila TaxID=1638984 RepID=UPI0007818283|nr:hypothetical protein [Demequina pelophila]